MLSNFTLQDILGTTLAFCLFPLVIVFPGYVSGWAFNLFEFRTRLLPTRFAISLLLSISISPILYYIAASQFSMNMALGVTALFALVFIVLLIYEKPAMPQDRLWRVFFWVSLGWVIFATLSLVDLQFTGNQLYFSVISFDHTTRVSIIDAMTRTGVPPINPSYYPGKYVHLTFLYFFWYILGSIIDLIGGSWVDARASLFASVLWCGLALMSLIAFYLRQRNGNHNGNVWKRALIGVASLSITGLDILPVLAGIIQMGRLTFGDIELWNEQITAWVGSLLWVPHHVASFIAGFVGIMLAHSVYGKSRTKQFVALVFSGVSFASALGLSVWVTLVFVLFWGIWMLFLYFQKKQRALLLPMFITGMVALFLAGPFLFGLLSGGSGAGSFPIALAVRSFNVVDPFLQNTSFLWQSLIRLIFLPLNYFLELGFFLFVAFIWLRSHKGDFLKKPYYLAEILLLVVVVVVGSFVRSVVIQNNDLGWRAWLAGQFVLLIWGVDVFSQFTTPVRERLILSPRIKYTLILFAVIGIATTVLDISLLRFGYYFAYGPEAGHSIYSARRTYMTINRFLPEDVIVQYNPLNFINRPSGLYGMHQSAISDRTAYGIPQDEYSAKVEAISKIFTMKNVQNWEPIDALCKVHFIDVILIVTNDPLWESLKSLEKQRIPLYIDNYYAAYTCGDYVVLSRAP